MTTTRGPGSRLALVFCPLLALACGGGNPSAVRVSSDRAALSGRIVVRDVPVTVDRTRTLQVTPGTPRLLKVQGAVQEEDVIRLVGEVHAPDIDGEVLQATGVVIRGQYAFVSYNVKGDAYKGAVQVIHFLDDTPELISEALFPGHDVNALDACGDILFLALASADLEGASVGTITLNPLKQFQTDFREVPLESYAANSLRCLESGEVVVTHGSDGGVSRFDKDLVRQAYVPIPDARSVASWSGGRHVVLSGSPATLRVVEDDAVTATFVLVGATIPESKSTVQVEGNNALVAVNDGGVQLVDLVGGQPIFTIQPPLIEGVDPLRTVSNSAAAQNRELFMAHGEAGVYLAKLDQGIQQNPGTVEVIGYLELGLEQSSNDVTYQGNKVFVAAGLGGFKILAVDAKP
jgi:hypothetical protein